MWILQTLRCRQRYQVRILLFTPGINFINIFKSNFKRSVFHQNFKSSFSYESIFAAFICLQCLFVTFFWRKLAQKLLIKWWWIIALMFKFHSHFISSFFIWKCVLQLFWTYSFCLYFFGKKETIETKLLVTC